MKKKFSLSALLHNDRLMIVVSLLIAVVVWAIVSFGPANIQTRTITATVKIDLTGTSVAGTDDLRVIGEDTFTVNIVVEGTRSVIYGLDAKDLEIKASLTGIQGPGTSDVPLTVNKVGRASGYTINSVTPSTVTVNCDYWRSRDFAVEPDLSQLKVADAKKQELGNVVMDSFVTDGLTLEGPEKVINRVASVKARVEKAQTLQTTVKQEARLVALDAEGKEVDISDCRFTEISGNTVSMTVPVWVRRTVDLKYTLANVPSGISQNDLVKLSQSKVTLRGEAQTLDDVAATVANLGVIDFDHITPDKAEYTVTLAVPGGVQVLEGNTVTVTLAIDKLATRKIDLQINSVADVTVEKQPDGKTVTLQAQKLSDITLCGPRATINRIKASDLKLTLDASAAVNGLAQYPVRITLPNHPNVWVYYGENDAAAYTLYGNVE